MGGAVCIVAVICALGAASAAADLAFAATVPTPSLTPADPYCTGSYGGAPASPGGLLRFGIDPGIAGSAGGIQVPSVPDDQAKDLAAV